MILFWIIGGLLLLLALLFIVVPLWRGGARQSSVQRDSANLEIFRDQMAELDADFANGLLTQEMQEQGKRELQSRLLDEVGGEAVTGEAVVRSPFKILSLVLIVLVPVLVTSLYLKIGNQAALLQNERNATSVGLAGTGTPPSIKELEAKLAASPEDVQILLMLARSYGNLERFSDAANAYDKLTRLTPNEAQLWADYADVLAMVSGKTLKGKPTQLLDKALSLDPANFKALALSGSAAMERGDYALTVAHWEKLLKLIPKEDESVRIVESGIQQARVLLAQKNAGKSTVTTQPAPAVQGGKEAVTGTVVLSDALKSQASPDDTLFVLVRAAEGPKMPLAIVRKQVKDLPLKFTLDDSTSMSPEMKMSNFEQVVVIARVSKSGNAMTQPGDLQGMSATIKPGSKGLKLKIDQVVP